MAPSFGDPTAATGRRIMAWIIDAIVYIALSGVLSILLADETKSYDLSQSSLTATQFCENWRAVNNGTCANLGNTVWTVRQSPSTPFFIFLGLFVLFCVVQGLLGGSLGKLALGLRIVKADGRQAGIGASFLRTLLWIVDGITCGLPIVGGICMLSTKGHRRVGDMAAGTFVVPKAQIGTPLQIAGLTTGNYASYPMQTPGAPYGQPGMYGQPPTGSYPPAGFPPVGSPGAGGPPAGFPPAGGPPAGGPPAGGPGALPFGSAQPTQDYEADKPSWDAKRNTYIQFDTGRNAWLEFDQATQEWKPISQ